MRHFKSVIWAVSLVAAISFMPRQGMAQENFLRGDANFDGVIDISDAYYHRYEILRWNLFDGGNLNNCRGAFDVDGGGILLLLVH